MKLILQDMKENDDVVVTSRLFHFPTVYLDKWTKEAIEDSKLNLEKIDKDRVGVIWGAGIGGLETFQNEVLNFADGDGTPRFNPFFIPKMIPDIAPGLIAMKYGFQGPNYATVSACASSSPPPRSSPRRRWRSRTWTRW